MSRPVTANTLMRFLADHPDPGSVVLAQTEGFASKQMRLIGFRLDTRRGKPIVMLHLEEDR